MLQLYSSRLKLDSYDNLCMFTFQAVLWRYKFSQLKGSSDDGKSKIKFLFQNQDSKSIEAKVIHFGQILNAACHGKCYSTSKKVIENEILSYVFSIDSVLFFRSWSFQTSSRCSTVFMLFLLPKLLAWTRCLWRAKALRLQLGFLPFPVSHVIHKHLNSNTPLDRRCSPRTPSERTLHLVVTVA